MDLSDEISPKDANELIHELRVHQIELEMQNDEFAVARSSSMNRACAMPICTTLPRLAI